ncbi:hypothetical protein Cni_G16494 [Canna indica]|uniref:Pectate lyase n=1 Tax=Canna indica TaxID=4628 RepID=A0AAQ3KGK6_9LILI|nr:hypothetical protein Cni_G16494 [Canna indica]
MRSTIKLLFSSLLFLASTVFSNAHNAIFDEYWEKKAVEAHNNTLKAYVPNPEFVVNQINGTAKSNLYICSANNTRRNLRRKYTVRCLTTNPIDHCWRCRADWESDRKRIARCAKGFGRHAIGSLRGKIYVVTDAFDDDLLNPHRGTLHFSATRNEPLWIIFARDMVIKLHDGDGVRIFGSSNIWIDHLSLSNYADGLIDAVNGSSTITNSNSHLTHHNDVILLGAIDSYVKDAKIQVSVAYNHFGRGLVLRMPRCRWGFFHVVNNEYTHWIMYAIGGNQYPTIISQGNRFVGPPNQAAKEVIK